MKPMTWWRFTVGNPASPVPKSEAPKPENRRKSEIRSPKESRTRKPQFTLADPFRISDFNPCSRLAWPLGRSARPRSGDGAKPPEYRQNMPVAPHCQDWQAGAAMNESEKQFSFTRAALRTGGRAETKFLSLGRTCCLKLEVYLRTVILAYIFLSLLCPNSNAASGRQQVDTIISGGTVVTVNNDMDVIEDGGVAIKDGTICGVGKRKAMEGQFKAKTVLNASGKIVMPGLVNTHTHIPMVMFRGYADDMPLMQWLKERIWPAEAKFVNPASVRIASTLALAEMIRSGTTTFNDLYFFEDVIAQVAQRSNIRAIVGEGLLDVPTPNSKTPGEGLQYTEQLIKKYAGDRIVTVAVGPHAPFTCSKELLIKARDLSNKYQLPLHIHVAETKAEVNDIESRYQMRPVAFLDSLGLLTKRTIAAHAIQLNDAELKMLTDRKTGVAHNPQSNMKLAEGVARVPEMLAAGVVVGLGTDGAASNNDLNMFEEMKAAALLHKVTAGSPTVLDARTVLRMATINGAEVLGLKAKIGSLEPGKEADIIMIDIDQPHLVPFYNVYSLLVYSADGNEVDTVMVAGKLVMRNKKLLTIDEKKAIADLRGLAEEIKKGNPISPR